MGCICTADVSPAASLTLLLSGDGCRQMRTESVDFESVVEVIERRDTVNRSHRLLHVWKKLVHVPGAWLRAHVAFYVEIPQDRPNLTLLMHETDVIASDSRFYQDAQLIILSLWDEIHLGLQYY